MPYLTLLEYNMLCPCGSHQNAVQCCMPYIVGDCFPATPETLMRSRYTAYSIANIAYIVKTMRDKALLGFDKDSAYQWAKRVIWVSLNVFSEHIDNPNCGTVEFEAVFIDGKKLQCIHEKSSFVRIAEQWYYTDGIQLPPKHPLANTTIGKNVSCPCGSQRKFKYCHGNSIERRF